MSTPNRTELANMIMNFYNLQANISVRNINEDRESFILEAVDRFDGDVQKVKDSIRAWLKENPDAVGDRKRMKECFKMISPITMDTDNEKPVSSTPTESAVANSLGILEQALVKVVAETSSKKIEDAIMSNVKQTIANYIKETYGTIERKVVLHVDGERKELPKGTILHEKFEKVMQAISLGKAPYIYGPAGSGKNVLCKQVADAMGLKFYFSNAVTQEYKITGYSDANGKYQESQFYKAFKNGGLFMLDEMDASIPEVLTMLNAALANGYFDFPAPIGYVEAHKDFHVIAAGNTLGMGADNQYVSRNQLDMATLNRFLPIPVDYSVEIENGVAGDIEIADFCRDLRKAAKKIGCQMVVSYRNIKNFADMLSVWTLEEALQSCLVPCVEKDDINMIINELPERDAKYKEALRKLVA